MIESIILDWKHPQYQRPWDRLTQKNGYRSLLLTSGVECDAREDGLSVQPILHLPTMPTTVDTAPGSKARRWEGA